MPKVGKEEFPYTPKGFKAAKRAKDVAKTKKKSQNVKRGKK